MEFRDLASKMDSVNPANTLAELINMHSWLPDDHMSFRTLARRHDSLSTRTIRFLSMNTYLMDVWGSDIGSKPAVEDRATNLSRVAKARHDIMLLQEIFEDNILDLFRSGWNSGESVSFDEDSRDATQNSSGLVAVSQIEPLQRLAHHEYDATSSIFDEGLGSKGILASILDPSLGGSKLELYNSHMEAGGDRESVRARMKQVNELSNFYRSIHDPANLAIISGDFNIEGIDSNSQYSTLVSTLGNLGLRDAWQLRNGSPGYTELPDVGYEPDDGRFQAMHRRICPPADDDQMLCDDNIPADQASRRLDYVFISDPHQAHTFRLDFTRPRRTRYERRPDAPERQVIDLFSDHLGISLDLFLSST